MNRSLLLSLFLASGCAPTAVDFGESDLPFDTIDASFVQEKSYEVDTDFDGTADLTVQGLGVVLSDRGDLCAAPGANLHNMDDAVGIQIVVLSVGEIESVEGNASMLTMSSFPVEGDALVGISVVERVGGETTYRASTGNLLDPSAVVDASFSVTQRTDDGAVSGSFEGTLAGLLVDAGAFDTDIDGDGTMDYEAISEAVSGSVSAASPCDRLDVLP